MSDRVELRPDFRQYVRWFRTNLMAVGGFAVFLVIVIGVRAARFNADWQSRVVAWAIVVMLLGTAGWVVGTIATSRVVLEPGRFSYVRWWVLRTTFVVPGQVHGLLATRPATGARLGGAGQTFGSPVRFLTMRDGDHGRRVRLNGGFWPENDLERIAHHVGIGITEEALTTRDWAKRDRSQLYWAERHPVAFGLVVSFVIVAGVVLAVTLIALNSPT